MAGMTADLRDENADGEFFCHIHVISHAHVDSDSRAPGEPPVYSTFGRRARGLLVKVARRAGVGRRASPLHALPRSFALAWLWALPFGKLLIIFKRILDDSNANTD